MRSGQVFASDAADASAARFAILSVGAVGSVGSVLCDAHHRAILGETYLPGGDNGITELQSLHDFHFRRAAQTGLDFSAHRFAVDDFPDGHLAALRHDRFLGNHQRVFTLRQNQLDASEHAGLELAFRVFNASAQRGGTARTVDLRIDRIDFRPEGFSRQRIDHDFQHLAFFCQIGIFFRHAEIHLDARDVFQVDQVGAVFHIVADADVADADNAGERRPDLELGQPGLRQRELRFQYLHVGFGLVLRPFGDELLACQILVAVEVRFRDAEFGFRLQHFGLIDAGIEPHQQLAFFHLLAIAEIEPGDAARDFGSNNHRLIRTQRPDRIDIVDQAGTGNLGHVDCRRRSACRRPRAGGLFDRCLWRALRVIRIGSHRGNAERGHAGVHQSPQVHLCLNKWK
jgi:hypothetical protein